MLTVRRLVINIVNIVLGVISFFLLLRIIFLLIPANSATPFVSWIYSVSSNLIYPFRGIIANTLTGNGGVLDWVAIISWLVYLILGALIISAVDALVPVETVEYLDEEEYANKRAEPATYHSVRRRRPKRHA